MPYRPARPERRRRPRFQVDEVVDVYLPNGGIDRGRIDYLDQRDGFADIIFPSQRDVITVDLEDLIKVEDLTPPRSHHGRERQEYSFSDRRWDDHSVRPEDHRIVDMHDIPPFPHRERRPSVGLAQSNRPPPPSYTRPPSYGNDAYTRYHSGPPPIDYHSPQRSRRFDDASLPRDNYDDETFEMRPIRPPRRRSPSPSDDGGRPHRPPRARQSTQERLQYQDHYNPGYGGSDASTPLYSDESTPLYSEEEGSYYSDEDEEDDRAHAYDYGAAHDRGDPNDESDSRDGYEHYDNDDEHHHYDNGTGDHHRHELEPEDGYDRSQPTSGYHGMPSGQGLSSNGMVEYGFDEWDDTDDTDDDEDDFEDNSDFEYLDDNDAQKRTSNLAAVVEEEEEDDDRVPATPMCQSVPTDMDEAAPDMLDNLDNSDDSAQEDTNTVSVPLADPLVVQDADHPTSLLTEDTVLVKDPVSVEHPVPVEDSVSVEDSDPALPTRPRASMKTKANKRPSAPEQPSMAAAGFAAKLALNKSKRKSKAAQGENYIKRHDGPQRLREKLANLEHQDEAPYVGQEAYKQIKKIDNARRDAYRRVESVFRKGIEKIEGYAGPAVAGYFEFHIFLLLLTTWMAALLLVVNVPRLLGQATPLDRLGNNNGSQVHGTESDSWLHRILAGRGEFADSALFYGSYSNEVVGGYNYPLAYFMILISIMITTLFIMVRNYDQYARQKQLYETRKAETPVGELVLGTWNFALENRTSWRHASNTFLTQSKQSIVEHESLKGDQPVTHIFGVIPPPSSQSMRNVVNVSVTLLCAGGLGAASFGMWYLQEERGQTLDDELWKMLVAPGAATLAQAIMPYWVKLCSTGMLFLHSSNSLRWEIVMALIGGCAIAGTYITGFLQLYPPSEVACWETRTGQEFYTLFVLDVAVRVGFDVLHLLALLVWKVALGITTDQVIDDDDDDDNKDKPARGSKDKDAQKAMETKANEQAKARERLPVFNITAYVLAVTYRQGLVWMAFPVVPMLPLLAIPAYVVEFFIRRVQVMNVTKPPTRVFRFTAGTYELWLLIAMVLAFLASSFIIFIRPISECGPFSGLASNTTNVRFMYNVIPYAVDRSPEGFNDFWNGLFGRGVVVPLLLLLIAFTYYWHSKLSGQRMLINELRYRSYLERMDHKKMARGNLHGSRRSKRRRSKGKRSSLKPNRTR